MLPRYNLSQSFHSASNIAKKQLQKKNEKYLIDTKTLKKHMDFRLQKKVKKKKGKVTNCAARSLGFSMFT